MLMLTILKADWGPWLMLRRSQTKPAKPKC